MPPGCPSIAGFRTPRRHGGELDTDPDSDPDPEVLYAEGAGYYHCLSRVVDRRMIMGDAEREQFRDLMRGTERFCGVRVLTYAIL